MPYSFGTNYTLAQGNIAYEYLRRNTWEVQIGSMDTVLLARTVSIPQYKLERGELWHFNDKTHFAMRPNPDPITIELYDAVEPGIVEQLWTWFQQVYDPDTSLMGYASTYKQQGQIFLYDPMGIPIRTWTAVGMFPLTSPTPGQPMDYTDQNPVFLNMQLSVDRVTLDGAASIVDSGVISGAGGAA